MEESETIKVGSERERERESERGTVKNVISLKGVEEKIKNKRDGMNIIKLKKFIS
jgi:hypothetical protein